MAKIQTLFGSLDELEKEQSQEKKSSLFGRMREAVTRTRENLSERIEEIVAVRQEIDQETIDDLEASLVAADLGVDTTVEVLDKLRERASHKQIGDSAELKRLLKQEIATILDATDHRPARQVVGPEVILVVGVNGTGKTTTLGKLAWLLRNQGKSVLLAAGDTFRAAAIEQLESGRSAAAWTDQNQSRRRSFGSALRRHARRAIAKDRLSAGGYGWAVA